MYVLKIQESTTWVVKCAKGILEEQTSKQTNYVVNQDVLANLSNLKKIICVKEPLLVPML